MFLLELPGRACSACSLVILHNGQSCETRARVIPSLLAISEQERTLPSLNCLSQKWTLRTTSQGFAAFPNSRLFRGRDALDILTELLPFSNGIETCRILSRIPARAAILIPKQRLNTKIRSWFSSPDYLRVTNSPGPRIPRFFVSQPVLGPHTRVGIEPFSCNGPAGCRPVLFSRPKYKKFLQVIMPIC
jgi:hypothetical protein